MTCELQAHRHLLRISVATHPRSWQPRSVPRDHSKDVSKDLSTVRRQGKQSQKHQISLCNPKTHIIQSQHYICMQAHSLRTQQLQQCLQGFERRKICSLGYSSSAAPGGQRSPEHFAGNNNPQNTCDTQRSFGMTSFLQGLTVQRSNCKVQPKIQST